jgi:hypothetical protein
MAFNPDDEPCGICGRDLEECVCAPSDFPDFLDEDTLDQWEPNPELEEPTDEPQ